MSSRRTAKIAQAVLEQVSSTILFELKDPRVKHVTVTRVEVADDVRSAKVYVSVMGDAKAQALCLHGLNSARGFLQAKIADRVQTRYTPILTFVLDQGIKQSIEASRILREVLPEGAEPPPPGESEGETADSDLAADDLGEVESELSDEDADTHSASAD